MVSTLDTEAVKDKAIRKRRFEEARSSVYGFAGYTCFGTIGCTYNIAGGIWAYR